jgi:uncharacterized protein YqjF (DUF2071 family)
MSGPTPQNTIRLPVNAQRWSALTFLHWPVAPAVIQERLPRGLHVQTYEGTAWIGLTPFLMQDVRVPPLPSVPGWSTFPEVNLRTYVRHVDGTDGLWFLGLWSTRRAMNAAMRMIGLPYHRTEATIRPTGDDSMVYDARPAPHTAGRRPLRLRAAVRAGARISAPTELEGRLTGRWNAYTVRAGHVWRVPVTHPPWPLRRATLDLLDTNVFETMDLPAPQVEPLVHVSPGVDTLIGMPRPAGRTPPTTPHR